MKFVNVGPFIYISTTGCCTIILHSLIVFQYKTDKSLRNQFNFFCVCRSSIYIFHVLISMLSFHEYFIFETNYLRRIFYISSVTTNFIILMDVLLAINRFIAIAYWKYYRTIFNSWSTHLIPLCLLIIVVMVKIIGSYLFDCSLNITTEQSIYVSYGTNISDCRSFEKIVKSFMVPSLSAAMFINCVTLVVLTRHWYKNKVADSSVWMKLSKNLIMFIHSFIQISISLIISLVFLTYVPHTKNVFLDFILFTVTFENRDLVEAIIFCILYRKSIKTTWFPNKMRPRIIAVANRPSKSYTTI
ncbi:unnamed protein product [Auanema sp. JU1783]|nr:unnamed protein product [Auanema sp. JU1783]